mgnify:FL=1
MARDKVYDKTLLIRLTELQAANLAVAAADAGMSVSAFIRKSLGLE